MSEKWSWAGRMVRHAKRVAKVSPWIVPSEVVKNSRDFWTGLSHAYVVSTSYTPAMYAANSGPRSSALSMMASLDKLLNFFLNLALLKHHGGCLQFPIEIA